MAGERILIVEDESIVASDLKIQLEGLGYVVTGIAASGEEAVQKALDTHPDLVVLDIRLKGEVDGIDAAARIRKEIDVPHVFITAYADEVTLDRAKATQPSGCIIKPFNERTLRANIEMALYKYQTDKRLKDSEERFRQIAENIREVFWLTDWTNNKVLYVSPAYEVIWGRSCQSLYDEVHSWSDDIHPEDRRRVSESFHRNATRGTYDEVYRIVHKDGSIRWIHDRAFPIKDRQGKVWRVAGISEDITGLKEGEEALHKAYDELEDKVKERTVELREEVKERRRAEDEIRQRAKYSRAVNELAIELAEAPPGKDLFKLLASRIKKITGALGAVITSYDADQGELNVRHLAVPRKHIAKINEILKRKPRGIKIKVAEEMLDRMLSEVVARFDNLYELSFGQLPKSVASAISKVFGIGEIVALVLHHGGEIMGTAAVFMPKDSLPLPLETMHIIANLGAVALRRKQAEEALRDSEERQRALFDWSADPILISNLDDITLSVNPAFERLFGYKSAEIVGKNFPGQKGIDKGKFAEWVKICRSGGGVSGYETERLTKSGRRIPVSVTVSPIRDAKGNLISLSFWYRDITERKRAQRELERRVKTSTVLASLTRDLYTASSVKEVLDVVVKHLSEAFPFFVSVSLIEEKDGKSTLSLKAYHLESKVLGFVEKLLKRKILDWPIPLYEKSVISQTMRTGHPTVIGLDFEPDEKVVNTDLKTMLESMVERKSPLRPMARVIADRVGDKSLLGIPFSNAQGEIIGSLTVVADFKYSIDDYNLGKVASDMIGRTIGQLLLTKELAESEERYRTLQENIPLGTFRTTPDGNLLYANHSMLDMLGYDSLLDFKPVPLERVYVDPEQRDEFSKIMDSNGSVTGFEVEVQRKDGSRFWASMNATAVSDESGSILYYDGIFEDITERKRSECIQSVSTNISQAVATSESLEELLEIVRRQLGRLIDTTNFYVALYEEDSGLYSFPYIVDEHLTEEVFEPEELKKSLTEYVRKTGKPLWVDEKVHQNLVEKGEVGIVGVPSRIWLGAPLKIGKRVIGVAAVQSYSNKTAYTPQDLELLSFVSENIALAVERKRVQDALRESEEFNRAVIEHSPLGVSVRSPIGQLLSANQAWKAIWAIPAKELQKDFSRIRETLEFDGKDNYLKEFQPEVRSVYQEGGYLHIPELKIEKPRKGAARWISQYFYAIKDDEGKVARVVILTEDITRRKEAGEALRESEERYRAVTEEALVGIYIYSNSKRRYLFVNREMTKITGYSRDELLELDPNTLPVPDDRSILETREKAVLGGKSVEPEYTISVLRKDGSMRVLSVRTHRITFAGEDVALGNCIDITERVKAEEALRESERIYRSLYESTLALADKIDLTEIITVIAEQAINILKGLCCTFYVWDEANQVLVPYYSNAPDDRDKILAYKVPLNCGLTGSVAKSRKGNYSNFDDKKGIRAPIPGTSTASDHLQSIIAEPLTDGDRLVGVINVIAFNRSFTDDDQGKLRILARQATIAYLRSQNLQALQESEERYRTLHTNVPVGVFRSTPDGRLLSANPTMISMLGFSSEQEYRAVDLRDVYLDPSQREDFVARLEAGGAVSDFSVELKRKDGSVFWASINASAVRDESGEVIHFDGILTDISERRRNELRRQVRIQLLDRLRETETHEDCLQAGCEAIRDAGLFKRAVFTTKDEKGYTTHYGYVGVDGKLVEELARKPPASQEMFEQMFKQEFKISHSYFIPVEAGVDIAQTGRYDLQKEESGEGPESWQRGDELLVPMLGVSGAVESWLSVDTPFSGKRPDESTVLYLEDLVDIVARQIREIENILALRASEERYRSLVETMNDGFGIQDKKGNITYVNERFCEMLGYSRREIVGHHANEFLDEFNSRIMAGKIASREQDRESEAYDLVWLRKNGEKLHTIISPSVLLDDKGDYVGSFAVITDITERKRAQERERQYTNILEFLSQAAMGFVSLPASSDIHKFIGENLKALAEDAIVVVVSFDSDSNSFTVRSVIGIGEKLKSLIELLGTDPVNMRFPVTSQVTKVLKDGALEKYPSKDLTELTRGKIPVSLSKAIIKLLNLGDIYVKGIVAGGELLGAAVIVTLEHKGLENQGTIDIFLNQASTALKRKLAEEALRESEERYRTFTEQALVGVYIYGEDDKFQYVNPAMEEIFGYTRDELLSLNPWDLVLKEDYEGPLRERDEARARGEEVPPSYEMRIYRKNGEIAVLEVKAHEISYGGKPSTLGNCIDVTERKRATETLTREHRAFRIIAEASVRAVDTWDLCQRVLDGLVQALDFDSGTLRLYDDDHKLLYLAARVGLSDAEQQLASAPQSLSDPHYIAAYTARSRKPIIAPDVTKESRLKAYTSRMEKFGEHSLISWPLIGTRYELLGVLHLWSREQVVISEADQAFFERVVGMFTGALERKLAENALLEERNRIQRYLDIAGVMMLVLDTDQMVRLINKRGCQILDYDEAEIVGKNWFDNFVPPGISSRLRELFDKLMQGKKDPEDFFENPVLTRDNEERIILWHNTVLTDDKGNINGLLSSGEDITERVKAETERDSHRQKLEALFEGVDVLLWSVRENEDEELYYDQVNTAFAEVEGYVPEHYNGRLISEIHSPEECGGIKRTYEWIQTGRPHTNEIFHNNRHFMLRFIPLVDPDGQIRQFIGSGVDITERKRAEDELKASEETVKARLFYEESISHCSRLLIETVDLVEALQAVANELRSVSRVSRVFMFEVFEDGDEGRLLRQVTESTGEKIQTDQDETRMRRLGFNELSHELLARLEEGRPYGGSSDDLDKSDIALLGRSQTSSMLILPIKVEDDLWGFIGFDEASGDRRWKQEDIQLLRTVGSMIGTTIDRKRAEAELQRHSRTIEGLYGLSKEVNRARTLEELLHQASLLLDDNPGVLGGGVYIIDKKSGCFRLATSFGAKYAFFEGEKELTGSDSYVQRVVEAPGLIVFDEWRGNTLASVLNESEGFEVKLVSVAMRSGEELIGILRMLLTWVDKHTVSYVETVGVELGAAIKRKQAEQALRESEERYRVLTDEAMVGVYLIEEGRFRFVNPAMERITGYSRDELLALDDVYSIMVHDDIEALEERSKHRRANEPDQYIMRIIRKDGGISTLEVRVRPIPFGDRVSFLGNCVDITEMRRVQQALEASEERYRVLTEEAMVGIYLVLGKKFLFVNPAMEKITGYSRQELTTIDIHSITHRDSLRAIAERKRHREPGQPDQYTMKLIRKDGTIADLEVRTRPIDYGDATAFLGNCVDITELVQKRKQIEQAKQAWESTFDSISDLVMILDPTLHVTRANRAVAEYTGIDIKQVIGKELAEIFNLEEIIKEGVETGDSTLKLPEHFEIKDPQRNRIFSVSVSPLVDPSGEVVATVHVARDITQTRKIEEALSESEAQFRGLAESAQDMIFSIDLEGKVLYVNPAIKEIFGFDSAQIVGENLAEIVQTQDIFEPGRESMIENLFSPEVQERIPLFETEIKDASGRRRVLEVSARKLPHQIVGIARDVTERKRMQQQLINASKLASVGVLAAGIAHQVNNPLAIMLATSTVLRDLLKESADVPSGLQDEVSEYLDMMEEQVERTRRVVSGLLEFTQPKRSKVQPCDVNEIVNQALELLSQHLKLDTLELNVALDKGLEKVYVDRVALQQALVNIIQNAYEALEGSGKIEISTEDTPEDVVRISVADNGPGVPNYMREEIFEPLFTTKTERQGTGLGLAVAVMLLERFGGVISLIDTPGGGATFVVEVPTRVQEEDK